MKPFQIKICGITNVKDATAVIENGADAIGLNFYPKSLRSVDANKALEIVDSVEGRLVVVGVFVNETAERINEVSEQLSLDWIQLHGDESPSIIGDLNRSVLRAIRIVNNDFDRALNEARNWAEAGAERILLDAASTGEYGGTGRRLDWELVERSEFPSGIVLAGGLNRDNVVQAIKIARPDAVDVASGIEKFPGVKDKGQLANFISEARHAFSHID